MSENLKRPLRSRSYLAILEMSVENPQLGPKEIAELLKRDVTFVGAIMRSDHFLEERAGLILHRYGDKLAGMRAKLIDTASNVLDAINRRISDPNSICEDNTLTAIAEMLLDRSGLDLKQASAQPGNATHVQINISQDDLNRGRALQAQKAETIHVSRPPLIGQQRSLPAAQTDTKERDKV